MVLKDVFFITSACMMSTSRKGICKVSEMWMQSVGDGGCKANFAMEVHNGHDRLKGVCLLRCEKGLIEGV